MKNMTVGRKVSLACAALVALTIALGISSLVSLGRVNGVAQQIVTDPMPSNYLGGRLNAGIKKMLVWMNLHIQSENAAEKAKLETQIASRQKQWLGEWQQFDKLVSPGMERTSLDQVGASFDRIMRAWEQALPLSRAQRHQEAYALYRGEMMPALEDLDKAVNQLVNLNNAAGDALGREAARSSRRAYAWTWTVLVLSVLCGGALAFLVVSGLNAALRRAASELAGGAEQVAAAAGQVSSGSQSLAQGNSEQAASLEETSASTEEINSMARRSSDNSRAAADLMAQSQQKFGATNQALELMVTAMEEISASSGKISKIIKVIDEIAFQTNILALNAAVEAARAGEAGMGFAVVADEVRNLAQRSAQAAKDTAVLIEESIAKSKDGKEKVDQVAGSIRGITEETRKVKTLVDEVSMGSLEQSRGIEQIAKAIAQMEQGNAANAEESAAAAEELTAQSETLKEIVDRLNAMVGGAEPGAHTTARKERKRYAGAGSSLAALRAAVGSSSAPAPADHAGIRAGADLDAL
jgi:methyl-accepting chemotaxis protein/methyl-accepting chemotaxis protein-1 (serine sensor receptor)